MRATFVLPVDGHDPPASAVIKQLNAVNPAHKPFRIICVLARFVRAPDMRDMSEFLGAPRDFFFVESVLLHVIANACDEAVDVQHVRRDLVAEAFPARIFRCWN